MAIGTANIMAKGIDEFLATWMQEGKESLISNYERRGQKASGEFAQKVEIRPRPAGSSMFAPSYAYQMVNGRRPNLNQDKDAMRKWVGWMGSTILAKWVAEKGISINPYAIAWKIARQGVQVPNAHNDGKLLEESFPQEKFDELYAGILNIYTVEIVSTIKKIWQ